MKCEHSHLHSSFPSQPQFYSTETNLLPQWAKINLSNYTEFIPKSQIILGWINCYSVQGNGIFIVYKVYLNVKNFLLCCSPIIITPQFFSLEHLVYCSVNVHKNWNTNIYLCFRKNDYVYIYLSKSVLNENQQLPKNPQNVH